MEWTRGKNTPANKYPAPPIFAEPCLESDEGAWRNLGGHWVRERRANDRGGELERTLKDLGTGAKFHIMGRDFIKSFYKNPMYVDLSTGAAYTTSQLVEQANRSNAHHTYRRI